MTQFKDIKKEILDFAKRVQMRDIGETSPGWDLIAEREFESLKSSLLKVRKEIINKIGREFHTITPHYPTKDHPHYWHPEYDEGYNSAIGKLKDLLDSL